MFESKHAEGMSLRCDVICALAYCGRHESSHIIKAHTDSARFNKKIICGNLCEFVADYLERGLHGLYGYVGLLNLCEGFLFVEGEWREIFCVNGVGDFDVPWFFCIFVIIKLSQA